MILLLKNWMTLKLLNTQGIDFHRPLHTSPSLALAHAALRAQVAFYAEDRYFAPDIAAAKSLVLNGDLTRACAAVLSGVLQGLVAQK